MLVHHSYDTRFVVLLEKLRNKYGEAMFELEGIGEKHLDINRYSKDFFKSTANTADKSVDGNANVSDASVLSWETESPKPIKKINAIYMLWRSCLAKHGIKRANKFVESEISGAIRIHDLHLWTRSYCYASSLNGIVTQGMPFYDKIKIGAAKHFDSYINLSLQYICYMSNQIAGAVGLPDFFVYMDYFVRKDYGENWLENNDVVTHVRQQFQSWIYSVNFSWRSNQSPFTTLSVMDKHWLKALFENHVNPDFSAPNFGNVDKLQRLFVDEYQRNLKNNLFTFPVVTACLLTDNQGKCMDEEFFDWVSEISSETGLFNFYIDNTTASLSSCCRLRSNIEEANAEYSNSFGVGGLNVGSHRVVALNLPRIAYEVEDWDGYLRLLEYRINLAQDILDIHRETIAEKIEAGRMPLYQHRYMDLKKQFSTVGFIGLNEALELLGFDIREEDGAKKAHEIISLINSMNLKRSKVDGNIRNVEQIPGEGAAGCFAKKDALLFEDADKYSLYSNQYIPLTKECSMIDRIIAQGRFDRNVGGGAILHLNLKEQLTKDQIKKLIEFCALNGVVYFTINYNFCQCVTCGKVYIGQFEKSPCHNADVKKYMRVVGFLTEVAHWSKERREEYLMRQFYDDSLIV